MKKRKFKIHMPVIIEVLVGFAFAYLRNKFGVFRKFAHQINEDLEITENAKRIVEEKTGKIKSNKCKNCNMHRRGICILYHKDIKQAVIECTQDIKIVKR